MKNLWERGMGFLRAVVVKKRFWEIVISTVIATILFLLASPIIFHYHNHGVPPQGMTFALFNQFSIAALAYEAEYDNMPNMENRSLTDAFTGNNPRKIVFMEFALKHLNEKGESIDPWGTPFRFALNPDRSLIINSAGKDKKWETKDDLTSKNPALHNP